MKYIENLIRNIPDFPKEGIQFKDITPVLADAEAFKKVIEWYALSVEAAGGCDVIAGIESRGFIFGSALSHKLNKGFVPIRKPGKLPFTTHRETYELEYGSDTIEIHTDAIKKGARVAIIDDLLATGGTAKAAINLIKKAGGEVACVAFIIELDFLQGRERLKLPTEKIFSFVHY
ncbi:MAG: adenine phosphoribosyltransferase [Spirochaetia bacterium]|nr:adenine phosphoribosyltransferase [Spirochaetia bacterium]